MLLTRFWILLLASLVGLSIGGAWIGFARSRHTNDVSVDDALARDRFELEALLKLDARARLDAIVPVATHPEIRSILRKLNARSDVREIDNKSTRRLQSRLEELNASLGDLHGNILWVVDNRGVIVGQIGRAPEKALSLGSYPLVRRALSGYIRDDVWFYQGRLTRMAARPVIEAGQYVGAVLHGMTIDERFSRMLAERLGNIGLSFFVKDAPLAIANTATEVASIDANRIKSWLPLLSSDRGWKNEGVTAPIKFEPVRAMFSKVTGSAADLGAGYVVFRSAAFAGSAIEFISSASKQDTERVSIFSVIAACIGLVLLGMGVMWLEHDAPLRAFHQHLKELADGKRERVITSDLRAGYRALGDLINQALRRAQPDRLTSQPPATVDDILGKPTESEMTPTFFGFQESQAAPLPSANEQLALPEAPRPAKTRKPSPREFAPPPPPVARPRTASVQESHGRLNSQPVSFEDEQTSLVEMPEMREGGHGSGHSSEDHAEYRRVYQTFLEAGEQCGQPMNNLSFEKFLLTLEKTRAQVLARPGVRDVRFTVYVKDGKPSLKATPVK